VLVEDERHAAGLAESAIGETDSVSLDELCRRGLWVCIIVVRASCYSVGTASGYDSQGCSPRLDVRSAPRALRYPDRPDNSPFT